MNIPSLIIWGQRRITPFAVDLARSELLFDISCVNKMTLRMPVAKLQALNPGVEINLQNISSEVSTAIVIAPKPELQEAPVLEEIEASDPEETQEMPAVEDDAPVSIVVQLQAIIDDPTAPLPYHVKSTLMDVYEAIKAQGDLILKQQQQLKRLSLFPEFGV